jgi:hypothetical protein
LDGLLHRGGLDLDLASKVSQKAKAVRAGHDNAVRGALGDLGPEIRSAEEGDEENPEL